MTTAQINRHVLELTGALKSLKAYLESLPSEFGDAAYHHGGYYVKGAIESLDDEIYELNTILQRDEEEED